MSTSTTATTIFLSNLHCPTCVHTIEATLGSLEPAPTSVHVSLIDQTVTVMHSSDVLSVFQLEDALLKAGFDLPHRLGGASTSSTISLAETLAQRKRKHVESCAVCADDSSHDLGEKSNHYDSYSSDNSRVRGTYSIGGMTCASCSGTITRTLSEMPSLTDVSVDLMGNSMTLIAATKGDAEKVPDLVDEIGYECTIVSIEDLQSKEEHSEASQERTVEIKIDGMFCENCPNHVMKALQPLIDSHAIHIDQPITSPSKPILKLTYAPSSPHLTIRTIISTLNSVSPKLTASLYKPPTIEHLSRMLQRKERRGLLFRLAINFVIAIPTFIIGIVSMSLLPQSHSLRQYFETPIWAGTTTRAVWALLILATPVQFYCAGGFHRRSIKEITSLWRKGSKTPIYRRFIRFGSMNLLISLGVSIAYFSSVALVAISSSQDRDIGGDSTTYFDSVVFLSLFLLFGRYLEAYSKSQTADAVASLGRLRPQTALLLSQDPSISEDNKDGTAPTTQKISIDLLELNDIARVLPGSTPPADGVVVANLNEKTTALFDEASLTGESRPVPKNNGDMVFVGTICTSCPVDIRVTKLGGETMLEKVVEVVRQGQSNRAPIERLADSLTGYFVPVVVLISIMTWCIWLGLGEGGALPQGYLDITIGGWPVWSLQFAIAVFVIACPCGIGLAAPTALLVGSGVAAKKFGILVRGGGVAFQDAANLDIIVFDKTGTLTEGGNPKVTDHHSSISPSSEKEDEMRILGMILSLESTSTHPLATGLVQYCSFQTVPPLESTEVEEVAGMGVSGYFPSIGKRMIVGNETLMARHNVQISTEDAERLTQWKSEGKSVVLAAIQSNPSDSYSIVSTFGITDPIRASSRGVVSHLKDRLDIQTWMISGDNEVTAKAVAKQVGIPENHVIANVLPHEKAERVLWLQRTGVRRGGRKGRAVVAMCGDGINDAPALTAADVGIAIGSGSDVAISSASFILIASNLWSIVTLVDLSKTVYRRIKFNFAWAMVYNVIGIPIAAGVIYPISGHPRLSPVWASLAMALSSVSVVTSSLLLRFYRGPAGNRSKNK